MKTNKPAGRIKIQRKLPIKLRMLMHCFTIAILWALLPGKSQAADLIVNGTTVTIDSGAYEVVYVTNDGVLTVNGPLTANTFSIQTGKADLRGNLSVSGDLTINDATFITIGIYNTASNVMIGAKSKASILGVWSVKSFTVRSGGVLSPVVYAGVTPGAGKIWINAKSILIEQGGLIDGNYAGNDPRGRANSFANAGGGGHGGDGAPGWWGASSKGRAFGDSYTFVCDMGSAGGNMGGGGIALVGETVTINGPVRANGQDGRYLGFQHAPGGGSGGTILIKAKTLNLDSTLSCNGGNGDNRAGPGGGGRIKVFYLNGGGTNLLPFCSVLPGPNHTDKGPAQAGTIWFDAIPQAPELIAPLHGDTMAVDSAIFRFIVRDGSVLTDGRDDMLFSTIELSTDSFATVAYRFSQLESNMGWGGVLSNRNNEEVLFTAPFVLAEGSYRWRVLSQDRSLAGDYSADRIVTFRSKPVKVDGSSSSSMVNSMMLYQNYPNPFNPSTRIKYQLAKQSRVTLTIHNLQGQEIATLVNALQPSGEYEATWQPKGLSGGLYFYRLEAGDFSETKKLILQK